MVSYFAPRGRFLIKAGNLRQVHQKHQQQQQQQQHQPGKWPVLRHFRKSFSSKASPTTDTKVDSLIRHNETLDKTIFAKGEIQRSSNRDFQQQRNVWKKWTGFLLRLAPVGFCVFGAIEWQLHKQKCEREKMPRTASQFQSRVYCSLPLRIMSRCWGWLASCYIPTPLRSFVYGWYSSTFDVNINEALHPDFKHYNSLSEFFTRPLRDGVRAIDQEAPLVSPADGRVLHFGSATNSLIEQVKGVNYSIESFLGPPTWKQLPTTTNITECSDAIKENSDNSTTLYQCVIYLAPGDYHRFHSPAEWQAELRRHFAGELLSVNPRVAAWLPELFCLNERAVYLGKWQYGFFSYTAVGATNVGSVQIYTDEKLKTNQWVGLNVGTHKKRGEFDELTLDKKTAFSKGQLVGQFNMGSTIVLLFEGPKNFVFDIEAGQKIRVGERLGHIANDK